MAEPIPYTGTFTFEGSTVVYAKAEPREAYEGSKRKKERGLRSVIVDGILRAYIVIPHGFGKRPFFISVKRFAQGYSCRDEDHKFSSCFMYDGSAYTMERVTPHIVKLVQDKKLPSKRELATAKDEAAERLARLEAEQEARRVDRAERRRKIIAGLESILERRMNLTAEEQDAVALALDAARVS